MGDLLAAQSLLSFLEGSRNDAASLSTTLFLVEARLVQLDRKMFLKQLEIIIGGQDRHIISFRNGTDQKIGI
jgi:hypothetical protein